MKAYVDTSVLIPIYVLSDDSARFQKEFERLDEIVISDLCEVEFNTTLARLMRDKHLNLTQAQAIYARLQEDVEGGAIQRIGLTRRHFERTAHYQLTHGLGAPIRTLDALHLMAAIITNVGLLTADERLHKAAVHARISSRLVKA